MKNRTLLLAIIVCMMPLVHLASGGYIYFDDGAVHKITDATHQNDFISLDYTTLNSPGTHLELSEGGKIFSIYPYKTSTVSITGGIVNGNNVAIDTMGDNIVVITGGILIGDIAANNASRIFVSGGYFEDLFAYDDGIVEVKGGLAQGDFGVFDHGTIYLYGNNFSVDGINLHAGDNLRDYLSLSPKYPDYLIGTIHGTLLDNSVLNNECWIWSHSDASIIVIPEPATLSLLALGVVLVRRKFTS